MSDKDEMATAHQIMKNLMVRCKEAKEWRISCFIDEAWTPQGRVPFDITIKDGIFTCRVIASNKEDAQRAVSDFLPVIKFIDDDE